MTTGAVLAAGGGDVASFFGTLLQNELLALFAVLAIGLALGRIRIAGLSFGSAAVLFVGLVFGHLGHEIPAGTSKLGLVLFVYCVGLSAGPSFFRSFVSHGKSLTVLSALLVVVAAVTAWASALVLGLPTELTTGIFAGAMTSTPALAAGLESLASSPEAAQIAVGYGLAYPFGVIGVVLFVQLLPRLVGWNLRSAPADSAASSTARAIRRVLVEVHNPAVVGRTLESIDSITRSGCRVSRVLRDRRLAPIPEGLVVERGQVLLVVGYEADLPGVIDLFGRQYHDNELVIDAERSRMRIVASSRNVVGRRLQELDLLRVFGVSISRITRHDLEFVPGADERVQHADMLHAVGEMTNLERFASFAGHRERTFDETDFASVTLSLAAGLVLGSVSFTLAGQSFSFGAAGGPLLVGLLLGHHGRLGPVTGHIPRASRLLLTEIGLVFFLAGAGVTAGGELVQVLEAHGWSLVLASLAVTFAPLAAGWLFASRVLKLNPLQLLGGVCGGMTSTPGLAAVSSATESETPLVSYAAAYPVALVLMTIVTQILVGFLTRA